MTADGCGAPAGGVRLPAGVDLSNQAVVQGRVVRGDTPVSPAYARLLDASGEFAGEVATDNEGAFRFFAAPGEWTVRVLAPGGAVREQRIRAAIGEVAELEVAL
jgi:hypothetical protein